MRSKMLLLGALVFLMTACSSPEVVSLSIKKTNETLPPQYQQEFAAIIFPDYATKTLDVSYTTVFPNDKNIERYKKRLVLDDEVLFTSFSETMGLLRKDVKKSVEGCTGGDTYEIEIEELSGEFIDKNVYVCGAENPYILLGDFFDKLQANFK